MAFLSAFKAEPSLLFLFPDSQIETEREEERERGFLSGLFFSGLSPSFFFFIVAHARSHCPVFFLGSRHDDRLLSANAHGSVLLM